MIRAPVAEARVTDDVDVAAEAPDTRIVWGLLDHDLPHAGQLPLLLRACGLPGVEI